MCFFQRRLIGVAVGIWACGLSLAGWAASPTMLMGKITDASNNTPCAGVFVIAFPNSYLPYAAYTDALGEYVLTLPVFDAGVTHYFVVTKTGYTSATTIDPPEMINGQANTKNASISIGGLISGHVRTVVGGIPIMGATVAATNVVGNVSYSTTTPTAADGSYAFRQPAGMTKLSVTSPLHASLPTRTLILTDKLDQPNVDFDLYTGGTITGRVTYAGTTIGAANVTLISVYGNTPDYLPQSVTYTAGDGTYVLQHVNPGVNHVIAFGPPGYANTIRNNLNVLDQQVVAHVNFELPLGGRLDGFVHDYLDRPVNQSVVTIYPATGNTNNQQTATTGPLGIYAFNGLTQGLYSIRVTPPQGANLQIAEFSGISLQGAVTQTTRNFILQPGGTVQGTVYDARHQPLAEAGVDVFVDMKYPFEKLVKTKTDAQGKYSVDGLSPFQNYTLSITPKASLTELNTAALVKGVTVSENAIRRQDFNLQVAGGRRGVITGATGNSLDAGSIIFLSADTAVSAELETDGSFILSYAPEGDYLSVVQNVAGHAQTITDYLHVTAGALEVYNRQLPSGAVLDGYVYDAAGNSLPGVKVTAKNRFDVLASLSFFDQNSFTDSTGYYRLEGVAPGTYALQVMPQTLDSGGMACRQLDNVTVQDKGTYRNNFTLTSGTKVYGSMHDTYGNRTFTGIIKFWSESDPANVGEAMADAWGNYSLMLQPGTYHAQAYFTSILGVNLAAEPLAAVTVPALSQSLQMEFVMQTGGTMSGRVTDPLGQPLNLCMVQVYQADNPLPVRVALTNSVGVYTIKGLHSGMFTVRAQTAGYSTVSVSAAARLGSGTERVDLVLIPQTSIAGNVQNIKGAPLNQALVQALDASGSVVLQTTTDAQGAYALSSLSGGPFQIKATATGLKSQVQDARYPGDRADFKLEPLIGHDEAVSYPNPCRGAQVSFLYWLDEPSMVLIRVYNQAGELVWDQEERGVGNSYNKQLWQVSGVAPGVYIFRVSARGDQGSQKVFPTGKLTIIK